jgi:hypothetical protein
MSQAPPVHVSRQERKEILHSLKATVTHIVALLRLEIDAVSKGDVEELQAIGHNLRKATEFEDSLLEEYASHLHAHQCSRLKFEAGTKGTAPRNTE